MFLKLLYSREKGCVDISKAFCIFYTFFKFIEFDLQQFRMI